MKKYLATLLFVMVILGLSLSVSSAQSCGRDPRTGRNIPCPATEPANQNTRNPDDSDGDGTVDALDRCPNSGGPAQNQGCPEDDVETIVTEETIVLAILPTDGDCVLATQGFELVNVREIPSLSGQIVAQLNPAFSYPLYFKLLVSLPDDIWYLTDGGWVFASVVRLGGDCDNVPTGDIDMPNVTLLSKGAHSDAIQRVRLADINPVLPLPNFFLQACDGSVKVFFGAQDIVGCDGSVMPFDDLQSVVECDGSVHPIGDLSDSCPESIMNFGILSNEDHETVALIFLSPASLVGFNPQPDPPVDTGLSPLEQCAAMMGLPSNELEEVDFNPQPDPPVASFSCLFITDGTSYGGPDSIGNGILIVNGYGGPDSNEEEQGIVIHGYGGPDSNEHGIVIHGYGGPDSNEIPSGINWTGISNELGNMLIIGENEGTVYVCPGSELSFNPQPEPPAVGSSDAPSTGLAEVGFNPQPEPPAICSALVGI